MRCCAPGTTSATNPWSSRPSSGTSASATRDAWLGNSAGLSSAPCLPPRDSTQQGAGCPMAR
eukprot:4334363-Prorocentrum_lima.AAC.1